jgi:hypothetical protein
MTLRWALGGLGLLLLASCGGHDSSASGADCPPPPASCPDLTMEGRGYVAVRTLTPPAGAPITLQEVGDGTYPACNVCHDPLNGLGSTDVWHLPGANRRTAVLGFREGTTDVFVVYVRQGVDPASVHLRSWAAP